jgi:GNAT superfamily N-acetyltransferase
LCEPDHRNDPATLDRWLANKTPESFVTWISNPDNFCAIEAFDGIVRGVGLLHRSGELRLFYVAPGHERRGIGRTIHDALISQARVWGLTRLHLESTSVARRFYESLGYRPAGSQKPMFGVLQAFPYEMPIPAHMSSFLRFDGAVRHQPQIDKWLDAWPPELAAIARAWFAEMRDCGPDVTELLHDGHPTACVEDGAFGYVNVFTSHVNIGFFHGATLRDPGGILQGTGRFMRHVKARPTELPDEARLKALIRAAYVDIKSKLAAERTN